MGVTTENIFFRNAFPLPRALSKRRKDLKEPIKSSLWNLPSSQSSAHPMSTTARSGTTSRSQTQCWRRTTNPSIDVPPFRFLDLPIEIRDYIYGYMFAVCESVETSQTLEDTESDPYFRILLDTCMPTDVRVTVSWQHSHMSQSNIHPLNLFLTNKQIYVESAQVFYSATRVGIAHLDSGNAEVLIRSITETCPWLQLYARDVSILGSARSAENKVMVQVVSSFQSLQRVQVRYDPCCFLPMQNAIETESFALLEEQQVEVEFKSENGLWIPMAEDSSYENDVEDSWFDKGRKGLVGVGNVMMIAILLLMFLVKETSDDFMDQFCSLWDL